MGWKIFIIYILLMITLAIILIAGSWILATIIVTNYLGLSGINWWLVSIVLTFIISGLIGSGTAKITRKK